MACKANPRQTTVKVKDKTDRLKLQKSQWKRNLLSKESVQCAGSNGDTIKSNIEEFPSECLRVSSHIVETVFAVFMPLF